MSLRWDGARVIERLRRASAAGINDVLDDSVNDAKFTHPWVNRRGQLEPEIKAEHATRSQPNPSGRFGYTRRRGFYGLFHEEGTVHERAYPTLRPAADRQFHLLADRIRERLR